MEIFDKVNEKKGKVIFMKNLSRRKRVLCRIAGVCMTILLLTACGAQPLPEQFDEETVKAEAEKAIEYFNNHDYQSIIDMGSDAFQELLTEENFAAQSEPYHEKCGDFQEIAKTIVLGNVNQETQESFGGVVMVGSYQEGTIQFTIAFDEDMKLVQFIIR